MRGIYSEVGAYLRGIYSEVGAYLRRDLFGGGGLFEGDLFGGGGLFEDLWYFIHAMHSGAMHSVSSHFVQGFGFIDLSNINVAMEVLSGPVLVRGGRRVVRPKVLILKTDFLQQGVQYLINLEVTNADGKSNAKILVTTPSPPVPGK